MSKVNVIAELRFKSESVEEALPILNKMVTDTRTEEGCLSYFLLQDSKDKTIFFTVEEWATQADIDRHLNSEALQNIMVKAQNLFSAEPSIHQCSKIC